jgi:hypothetical protein
MEFILWALIFLIVLLVFKALKFEETSISYQQKDLINRYLDIKQIDSDYRLQHLRNWEKDVELFVNENPKKSEGNVINFKSHTSIK